MKLSITVAMVVVIIAALPIGCAQQEAKKQEGSFPSSAVVLTLDESSFDSQVQSGVVLVSFWRHWCWLSKMQRPIVEKVAVQVAGKAKVAKLDVDAARNVADRFNVHSLPTLVVLKDGKPVKQFVGVTEAETLVSAITSALGSK